MGAIKGIVIIVLGIIIVVWPIVIELKSKYYFDKLFDRYKEGIDIGCATLDELREKLFDVFGTSTLIKEDYVVVRRDHKDILLYLENNKVKAVYPSDSFGDSKKDRLIFGFLRIFKLKKAISISRAMDDIVSRYNLGAYTEEPMIYKKASGAMKGMIFIYLLIVVIAVASIVWASKKTGEIVETIKNSSPEGYPNYTYGKTFDKFFDETEWEYYTSDGGDHSAFESLFNRVLEMSDWKERNGSLIKKVKFTGRSYSDSIEVVVYFTVYENEKDFGLSGVEINGEKAEVDVINDIFDMVSADVENQKSIVKKEKNKEKPKKKKQKKTENNKKTTKKQEKATVNNYNSNEYLLPYSDSTYLTDSDLRILSSEELRLARNEIFARYGRMFKDAELQNYFNQCSWYKPLIKPEDFNENQLNVYEKANIKLIKQHEKAAASGNDSIYFVGLYTDGNGIYVDMQQYSSPSQTVYGLNAGYIDFFGEKVELYKNSTNNYSSEDGSLQIKVKGDSIVLTGTMTFSQTGEIYDVSGDYNLQSRYPRP